MSGRAARCTVVIAKQVGRLANRLLLYAHFIGAAAEHGFSVLNPSFHPYAGLFPATARDLLCRFPPGRRVWPAPGARRLLYEATLAAAGLCHRRQVGGRDVGLVRLRRDQQLDLNSDAFLDVVREHRVVFVQDWFFRSAENCARHRDLICRHLTPSQADLGRARAAVEPIRARDRLAVGVHVRRGDYETFKGGIHYHSLEQYRCVLEAVEAAFPEQDVSFLVCSDGPVAPEAFDGLDVVRGPGDALGDLYALAYCDRLVGPPSTFNAWASYYGEVPLYRIEDPAAPVAAESFRLYPGLSHGIGPDHATV
jgi:hypothetical protein